jgi:hypothetical protein
MIRVSIPPSVSVIVIATSSCYGGPFLDALQYLGLWEESQAAPEKILPIKELIFESAPYPANLDPS